MNYPGKTLLTAALLLLASAGRLSAQETEPADTTETAYTFSEDAPMLDGTEKRLYRLRDIRIHGVRYLNKEVLKSSAGLAVGDSIYLPSSFISTAIDRLWNQRLFSDVRIGATIDGDDADLEIFLRERPRVYSWNFEGVTKSKQKDLMEKLQLRRGTEYSDYVIDKNRKLIEAYWAEKGFRNARVEARIENDAVRPNAVNVTFVVDRGPRVRIGRINFTGNEQFTDKRLRRTFKKTHQKSLNFLRNTKLKESDFEEDKD